MIPICHLLKTFFAKKKVLLTLSSSEFSPHRPIAQSSLCYKRSSLKFAWVFGFRLLALDIFVAKCWEISYKCQTLLRLRQKELKTCTDPKSKPRQGGGWRGKRQENELHGADHCVFGQIGWSADAGAVVTQIISNQNIFGSDKADREANSWCSIVVGRNLWPNFADHKCRVSRGIRQHHKQVGDHNLAIPQFCTWPKLHWRSCEKFCFSFIIDCSLLQGGEAIGSLCLFRGSAGELHRSVQLQCTAIVVHCLKSDFASL